MVPPGRVNLMAFVVCNKKEKSYELRKYPQRDYGHSCTPFPQPIQASFTVKACWAHYGTKPLPQHCGRGFV